MIVSDSPGPQKCVKSWRLWFVLELLSHIQPSGLSVAVQVVPMITADAAP